MGVKPLPPFLILLVLLIPIDDVWASATPDPSDDIAASENNDFQPTVRRHQEGRPDAWNLALPGQTAHPPADLSGRAAFWSRRGKPRQQAPVGVSLLLALMSLQR